MTTNEPELSSTARALLDAARDGMAPDAAAIERVRAKVAATAGGGVAASALALKLGIAGVVVALALGAIVQTTRGTEPVLAPALAIPSAPVEDAPAPVVYEVAPPPPAPEPAPIEMAAESMRRAVAVAPAPVVSEPVDLAREVVLIDRATAALAKGDPQRALATLRLHAVETRGEGQLAEDAAAIEIEALCRLHAPSVAAKLEAFDVQFPRSAQRSRLTSRCRE